MSKHPYHRLRGILFLTIYLLYTKVILFFTGEQAIQPSLASTFKDIKP